MQLKWSDIKDDEIYIDGKGDKRRKVPLNEVAQEIIERSGTAALSHRESSIWTTARLSAPITWPISPLPSA
ncbi:MAG: hypothetical protein KJ908_10480 [Acidobacteria bacterium]|nr:hypothetical protein [Acidobacteriota bacterium]